MFKNVFTKYGQLIYQSKDHVKLSKNMWFLRYFGWLMSKTVFLRLIKKLMPFSSPIILDLNSLFNIFYKHFVLFGCFVETFYRIQFDFQVLKLGPFLSPDHVFIALPSLCHTVTSTWLTHSKKGRCHKESHSVLNCYI